MSESCQLRLHWWHSFLNVGSQMSHKKHASCWRVHSVWKHFVYSLLPPLVWPCSCRGQRLFFWGTMKSVGWCFCTRSGRKLDGGWRWHWCLLGVIVCHHQTANTSHAALHRAPHPLFEMKHCSHLLNWSHRGAESGKVIGQSICQWQVSITPARIMQSARAVPLNK